MRPTLAAKAPARVRAVAAGLPCAAMAAERPLLHLVFLRSGEESSGEVGSAQSWPMEKGRDGKNGGREAGGRPPEP